MIINQSIYNITFNITSNKTITNRYQYRNVGVIYVYIFFLLIFIWPFFIIVIKLIIEIFREPIKMLIDILNRRNRYIFEIEMGTLEHKMVNNS